MMQLDSYNVLDKWPLDNLDRFLEMCRARNVHEVYCTGTNTDPLLFMHLPKLATRVQEEGMVFGIRTNGVAALSHPDRWMCADKASLTICSLNPEIYRKMMGQGEPPNLFKMFFLLGPHFDRDTLKVNIVLGPENTGGDWNSDVVQTILMLASWGCRRINLREPYGQPHVGDPLRNLISPVDTRHGMPMYRLEGVEVVYWDVHWVEVESVNLYASGRISETYPITRGCAKDGIVMDQSKFTVAGRVHEQWVSY